MADMKLPKWANLHTAANKEINRPPKIVVDPDKCYPVLLDELTELYKDDEKVKVGHDQYWIECVYQMMKMDLQMALGTFNFQIKVLNRPKWELASLPEGKGIYAATKGYGARSHYKKLRGALPA